MKTDRLEEGANLVVTVRTFTENFEAEVDLGKGAETDLAYSTHSSILPDSPRLGRSVLHQASKFFGGHASLLDDRVQRPFRNSSAEMHGNREGTAVGGPVHRKMAALLAPSHKAGFFEDSHQFASAKCGKFFRHVRASH